MPSDLLDRLSKPVRNCLVSKSRITKCFRGSTISLQGDPAKTVKIVQSGWVKLYRMQPNGDEAVLATLTDGESFEEIEALTGGRCPSSAEALTDCILLHVDLSAICSCENAYREISTAVLAAAADHLDSMRTDIEQLKVHSGVQRLLHYLLSLSAHCDDRGDIVLPYEKNVLAGKLGMRPESLSRAFARLKPLGVRSRNRKISIADLTMLRSGLTEMAAAA